MSSNGKKATNKNNKQKSKNTKTKKKILKVLGWTFAAIIICCSLYGLKIVTGITSHLEFDKEKLYSNEPSPIYDSEGKVIYTLGSMNSGTRVNVSYNDLPQVLVDAVVATEDSRFFEHNGFDLPRILKAAVGNIANGGITSGGSTITQQLIKKSFYSDESVNKWERKIGEIFLATNAEKVVSKEDILTLYLNKIAFGRGLSTLGIQAGAKYYFNKDVQQLTLPEAALLAGTLNAPDAFDPYYNLDKATKRRNVVLDLMYRHGYITKEEMEAAKSIKVENMLQRNTLTEINHYQGYIDTVLRELDDYTKDPTFTKAYPSLKDFDVSSTPVEIHTFLDSKLQDYSDQIASGEIFNFANDDIQLAASIQDTTSGKIIALIGGRDYFNENVPTDKRVNQALEKKQPGSSLKPIISYASAFEFLNWSTGQSVSDAPWSDPSTGHTVKNWNGPGTNQDILLTDALANSYNLPAIHTVEDVINEVGINKMNQYLSGFGFDMSDEEFNALYSIGGWKNGVTAIQLAAAYAALSNGGNYIKPHTIDYIIIKETGEKIDIHNKLQEPKRAISEDSAFMITKVMESYTKSMYQGMNIPYDVAGKSGTSDWGDEGVKYGIPVGVNRDCWLSAYTEDYAASVWVGYYGDAITKKGKYPYGDIPHYPQRICGMLLNKAQNGTTKRTYTQPEGVVQDQMIKGITPYAKPTADTPPDNIITAWFKKDNTPTDLSLISSLNKLSSFTVSGEPNSLSVAFEPYDNSAEDKKTTDIFGKPVYTVEVRSQSTGSILYTKTDENPTFNLDYTPTESVDVVGFYSREKSPTIKSNEISYAVKIDNTDSFLVKYYKDSIDGELLGTAKFDGNLNEKINLSSTDLNKFKPQNYNDGTIDQKYSASIITKGDYDVVYVVYLPKQTSSNSNHESNSSNH